MINLRAILWDDEDNEAYQMLRQSVLFKELNLVDLFALSITFGIKRGRCIPNLMPKRRIRDSVIKNSDVYYLMMALGVNETDSLDVLSNDEYQIISEEYAKTGINILKEEFLNDEEELLNKMEREIIAFSDEFIEED